MRGYRLVLVSALWTALTIPVLGLFVASVPALHARQRTPRPAVQAGLDQLGLPVPIYAGYWSLVLIAFAVLCFAVAGVIVWRRPREPMAWFGALIVFLFTFPDGRFVPRLAWLPAAAAITVLLAVRGSVGGPIGEAVLAALAVGLIAGLGAQVYRYRRISTTEQRQQTKWVTVAAAAAVTAQLVFPLLEGIPALRRPGPGAAVLDMASVTGVTGGYALIPLAVAMAVLRQRLWDVDVVINRTLVYGGLTAALLAVYVLIVGGLDRLVRPPGDAGVALLAAGLVALLFARCSRTSPARPALRPTQLD